MIHKKCKLCYNKNHRHDLCIYCKWLYEEKIEIEKLEDNYRPQINNDRSKI